MTQQERQAHSRREILQAATEEFGRLDYAQVNMENICKNHNISKGMMYHYYSNKDELFLLCVEDTFHTLREYVERDKDSLDGRSIPDRIKGYLMIREYFFQLYPKHKRIFETAMLHPPKHLYQQIQALREPLRQLNREFLEQTIEVRNLRPGLERDRAIRYLESIEIVLEEIFLREQLDMHIKDLHTLLEVASGTIDMLLYGVLQQDQMIAAVDLDQQ